MIKIPEKIREAYRELPPDWKLEKLKFFADIRNSNVDKTISEDEQLVRLCNYTDVYYNDRITPNLQFMEGSATETEIARFHLKRDQVIITKDSEGWDDIGIPALVTEDMPEVLCGYHLSVFEPGLELDGGFLTWLCRAEPLNDQFKLAANGVTRFGLGLYPMKNAFIALPPLDTQRRVVRFLDDKTAQIDGLIAKKRGLLDRLAEKRQALITRAVTGDLNPDASMMPTNIEVRIEDRPVDESVRRINLLAETPEHWIKASVGCFCDVQLGKMLQNDPSSEKDELKPYLKAINVGKDGLDLSHEFSMWIRPQEADRFRLTKGDILVSEGGDAGRTVVFDVDGEFYFQNAINRIRPNHLGKIEPEFIYYWFTFLKITGYVEMVCNVATIPHFTAEKVKAAPIALPPIDTQRRIVQYLDEKTTQIDGLVNRIEDSVVHLEEYRSAQITAAVTGQISELQ